MPTNGHTQTYDDLSYVMGRAQRILEISNKSNRWHQAPAAKRN